MSMNWRDERRLEQEQRDRDYEAREDARERAEAIEAAETRQAVSEDAEWLVSEYGADALALATLYGVAPGPVAEALAGWRMAITPRKVAA